MRASSPWARQHGMPLYGFEKQLQSALSRGPVHGTCHLFGDWKYDVLPIPDWPTDESTLETSDNPHWVFAQDSALVTAQTPTRRVVATAACNAERYCHLRRPRRAGCQPLSRHPASAGGRAVARQQAKGITMSNMRRHYRDEELAKSTGFKHKR